MFDPDYPPCFVCAHNSGYDVDYDADDDVVDVVFHASRSGFDNAMSSPVHHHCNAPPSSSPVSPLSSSVAVVMASRHVVHSSPRAFATVAPLAVALSSYV